MLGELKEALVGWGPSFVAPDRPDQVRAVQSAGRRSTAWHGLSQLSSPNNFAEGVFLEQLDGDHGAPDAQGPCMLARQPCPSDCPA